MKHLIIKLFRELENMCEGIINSLESNCYQIFRGGIFLIGISLAGLSQTMPVLLDHEQKAMELKYDFEEISNTRLNDAKCENFKALHKECNLAKYKVEVVSSTIDLLNTLVRILFFIGLSMLPFSILGYVIKATSKKSQTENTPETSANV
ncbi:hypothetical protein DT594_16200 [Halopseudomonas laoshanensis]|uniref:Uncharacterized protein n=1 Tax=Halopseudomonas laoshanensis TaxID=2268758 RepID=A0A7V7GQJ9_9GAMM|nr:hypothetical protein [Halopseudomonas laoshanensis]KAA0692491.1 hypothetical protein DT594_16200 [Halopseudomonas laoshanensis]